MKHLSAERFVRVWELARSVTEVSVRLVRSGYSDFSPEMCMATAYVLGRLGVNLKEMPRGDLPGFSPEQEGGVVAVEAAPSQAQTVTLPAHHPAAHLVAPDVPAECSIALRTGAYAAWSRGAHSSFASWYAHEQWPFKPGSND